VWDNEADMGADPEPFDLQEGDVMGPPLHQDHAGLGVMPMKLDVDLDASLASAPTSYEELCRQHIVRVALSLWRRGWWCLVGCSMYMWKSACSVLGRVCIVFCAGVM